jgi:hypothetical protein
MTFIEYAIAIICFGFLFWYLIFMVISLPSMPFVGLLAWATREQKTHARRVLRVPIMVGAFVFRNLVPSLFYSLGIFAITNYFMQNASHPIIYAIVGGLLCLWIRAPSWETDLVGTVISVVSYLLYMAILEAFVRNVSDIGFRIVKSVFAVLLPVFIIGLITAFIFWVVSKARGDHRQQKRFQK